MTISWPLFFWLEGDLVGKLRLLSSGKNPSCVDAFGLTINRDADRHAAAKQAFWNMTLLVMTSLYASLVFGLVC